MSRKPYVGVTGFMSQKEVHSVLDAIPPMQFANYLLMAGILVGSKTLRGEPNRHPGRFPKMEQMQDILFPDPRVLWLIHFHTEQRPMLLGELKEVMLRAGLHCNGVQLNIAWPEPLLVQEYWEWLSGRQPDPRVVLQVGSRAMNQASNDPLEIAQRVGVYSHTRTITDVLIDPSGGAGQPFNPIEAAKYLQAIHEECPELGLGIAGGLSTTTLGLLDPLISVFSQLNIDAEGKLRNQENDGLNMAQTVGYVSLALGMLQKQ